MITLYGKQYAKNDREFTGSLFTGGATCNGYYKATARGLYIYDHQHTPVAFIRRDGMGPVSVSKHNGRWRYMFALSSNDAAFIGVPHSYIEQCDGAKDCAESVFGRGIA